jgi:hypothetical protein
VMLLRTVLISLRRVAPRFPRLPGSQDQPLAHALLVPLVLD